MYCNTRVQFARRLFFFFFCFFVFIVFFFNDTATTEIYTLSLHDALPISVGNEAQATALNAIAMGQAAAASANEAISIGLNARSEEHTSELQSRLHLVCRLLLEKKKKLKTNQILI